MTDQHSTSPATPFLPSLGTGRIIADTFSLYFRAFFRFFPLGCVIMLVSNGIVYQIYGDLGQNLVDEAGNFQFGKMIFANITVTIGYSIFMSILILSVGDFKQGQPFRIGGYFQVAVSCLLPILILQIVYAIGLAAGLVVLIVPGLYLMAMWSVLFPAILIDQVGFRGLQRSTFLTRDYRWSILGPLIVFIIAAYFIIFVSTYLAFGSFVAITSPQVADFTWTVLTIQVVGTVLGTGLLGIGSLVIFNRLKEIKEGGGVTSELVEVFD